MPLESLHPEPPKPDSLNIDHKISNESPKKDHKISNESPSPNEDHKISNGALNIDHKNSNESLNIDHEISNPNCPDILAESDASKCSDRSCSLRMLASLSCCWIGFRA